MVHSGSVAKSGSQYLHFALGEHALAIPGGIVREVLALPALSTPPCVSELTEGFLDMGGRSVSVWRLSCLLGLPKVVTHLYTPIAIIQSEERLIALLIDRVIGLIAVPDVDRLPVRPEDSLNGCIEAALRHNDAIIHLLSFPCLLRKAAA